MENDLLTSKMDNVDNSIKEEKIKLVFTYLKIMMVVFILNILIFSFIVNDNFMSIYMLAGFISLLMFYFLAKKSSDVLSLIKLYLIFAPIYIAFLLFRYWEYSMANIVWLLPAPLAAYIFFNIKKMIYFTVHITLLVVTAGAFAIFFGIKINNFSRNQIIISDSFIFLSNIVIIFILLYYRERIRNLEVKSQKNTVQIKDVESLERKLIDEKPLIDIFEKIEKEVDGNENFTDPEFNISKLSILLNINPNYISKAIRLKGYTNFNHYINTLRVEKVKVLLSQTNLDKVKLMYIYTKAGFSNQSTFNRVFKQIEGFTPSEYLDKME